MKPKNIIILILSVIYSLNTKAQSSYSIFPNDTLIETAQTDFINVYDIYQKNLSNIDSLVMGYEKLSVTLPSGWDYSLCVFGTCYIGLPQSGVANPIGPGKDGFFALNVNPSGINGSGAVRYKIFDVKNPTLSDTITWIINYATAGVYSVDKNNNLKIFPTLVQSQITISQDFAKYNHISIIDLMGKELKNQTLQSFNLLDLVEFKQGFYYLILSNKDGEALSTKILKK